MTKKLTRDHLPFEHDAQSHQGYKYTTEAPLSAQVANQRLTQVTLNWLKRLKKSKTVIDLGCGDGAYTGELAEARRDLKFSGAEPARSAVSLAQKRYPKINFFWFDLLKLKTFPKKKSDAAIIRGVIHHVSNPALGIKNGLQAAKQILIIEPNGWNPIVKVIEKVSPYHRAHGEKSYTSTQLTTWCKAARGNVTNIYYVGLVPFFCPTPAVPFLKTLEPIIEKSPVAWLLCGQVILEVESNLK